MSALYIASTYYHALIACVKQLAQGQQNADTDILVTDYIPQYLALAERLAGCGIFRSVFASGRIEEYVSRSMPEYVLFHHRKNAGFVRSQLKADIESYDDIYIFHDDTWAAHYLKCSKTRYHLIEDALDSFKTLNATKFRFMAHNKDLRSFIKNTLRIGYVYGGYDRYTASVEVNDASGVDANAVCLKKLIERPRKELFDRLTDDERKLLCSVFVKEMPQIAGESSALLLTSALAASGAVSSDKEQERIIREAAARYCEGFTLVIKPHPSDMMNYGELFPDAVILEKNMPIEILSIVCGIRFARAVSFGSTSAASVLSDEHITVGLPK